MKRSQRQKLKSGLAHGKNAFDKPIQLSGHLNKMGMEAEYLIIEPWNTLERQLREDQYTLYRLNKVSKQLFGDKSEVCDLLPFKGVFPIVKPIYSVGFVNSTREHYVFDELVDSIKETVREAERYKYFENLFVTYLKKQNVTPEAFKKFQPKHRQMIIDEWQLADKIPDWLLE